MKKVLIFGVNGFVGKYMTDELIQHGYDVYGCGIREGNLQNGRFEAFYVCDLLDADGVKNVISEVDPDIIINLAGRSSVGISWRIPRNTVEINVGGSLNILEAVRSCDINCKILMIGSSEEYDGSEEPLNEESPLKATNPYGISKMMLESFANTYRDRYGMKIYFVRAFNHTGIGQTDSFVIPSWCRQAAIISESGKTGVMTVGNLDIVRDFSNVKDVVRAYRMILESDDCSVVYNVGSGEGTSLRDILNHIISLSRQTIDVQIDPKLIRPVENRIICCDRTLISRNIGWEPQYNIYETAEEIFSHYLEKEQMKNKG